MITLPTHQELVSNFKRYAQGQGMSLDAQYKASFQAWESQNRARLHLLSPQEQAESFIKAVQVDFLTKASPLALTREDMALVKQGRVLLASRDGGLHFDTLIRPEDLIKVDATSLGLFSATLRGSTTNLEEVLEEQALITVVSRLESYGFLVQNAWIEGHAVHVDAIHPKGSYHVSVPLNKKGSEALAYQFLNRLLKTQKVVLETQLPEAFGELVPEKRVIQISQKEENLDAFASLAGSALFGLNQMNQHQQMQEALAMDSFSRGGLSNVMESKARQGEAKARFEQQNQSMKKIQDHYEEAKLKQVEEERQKRKQKLELQAKQNREQKQIQQKTKRRRQIAWLGAGLGAGAVTSLGAGAFGLTYIANFV
jgi:hypothetical protein